jgi:polyisoprenoid-binding protein YceI
MQTRSKLLSIGAAALAIAVLSAASAWYFVIRGDAPAAVSLQGALSSLASDPGTAGSSVSTMDSALSGTWTVVQGAGSFAGYRVGENLAGVGSTTAVGRTQQVDGSLTYNGDEVTDVEVTADVSTLQSDKSQRDNALKMQALQTATYPTATFVLKTPIEIDQVPTDGTAMTQTVLGDLTLHGVTREVELDVEGALQGNLLVVVGSTQIQFADYRISSPKAAAVLAVDDYGVMEFQLLYTKA